MSRSSDPPDHYYALDQDNSCPVYYYNIINQNWLNLFDATRKVPSTSINPMFPSPLRLINNFVFHKIAIKGDEYNPFYSFYNVTTINKSKKYFLIESDNKNTLNNVVLDNSNDKFPINDNEILINEVYAKAQ